MIEGVKLSARAPDLDGGRDCAPKFKVQIRNAGRTPGFVESIKLSFAPAPKGTKMADVAKLPSVRSGSVDFGFFLGPGSGTEPKNVYGGAGLKAAELANLRRREGEHQLFVWGVIVFRTAMEDRVISTFAYRVSLVGTPNAKGDLEQKNIHVGGRAFWRHEPRPENEDAG